MVNYPNYLAGSQDDINKRLLHMILDLKKSEGAGTAALEDAIDALETRVKASEDTIGDESTEGTILARVKALEDAE